MAKISRPAPAEAALKSDISARKNSTVARRKFARPRRPRSRRRTRLCRAPRLHGLFVGRPIQKQRRGVSDETAHQHVAVDGGSGARWSKRLSGLNEARNQ